MVQTRGSLLEGPCSRMPWYTDLQVVFEVFAGREREFDWLVTDLDCNPIPVELQEPRAAWWFRGEALSELVRRQDPLVQFHWAVLTGFERGAAIDPDRLQALPYADGNPGFWHGNPRTQHPDALVELVCWDSGSTILITSDADLTRRFRAGFPEAVDLAEFNQRRGDAG